MYYDPFLLNTDYEEEREKNIVIESLITLYQYCWNIRKPKEMQSSKTPFDDVNELFEKEDSYFYQFKMENKCVPMQQDNHNCSLVASLAIIRICQALENHDITKEWIDKEERTKQCAIIPLSYFSSIKYNMFDKNHLHYCRMDLIELIDGLCVMTNKAENLPKELDIFKTKVLAELLHANPYEDPLHLEFLSKCDFVHKNFDHYINGKKEADVIALPFKRIHEKTIKLLMLQVMAIACFTVLLLS